MSQLNFPIPIFCLANRWPLYTVESMIPDIVKSPPTMAHADVMKEKKLRRSSWNVTRTGLRS